MTTLPGDEELQEIADDLSPETIFTQKKQSNTIMYRVENEKSSLIQRNIGDAIKYIVDQNLEKN